MIADGLDLDALKLIVCLGNPGEEYAETRHNAGWQVADVLMKQHSANLTKWQPYQGNLYKVTFSERKTVLVLKPLTYMNLSGKAVKEVMQQFCLSPGKLLVLCDDLDLAAGSVRLRRRGSSGGQKGIESIITEMQTAEFARLRIGIGRPESGTCSIVDYVLGRWIAADLKLKEDALQKAAKIAESWFEQGIEKAFEQSSRI
ncbi:MAG: aminoacyl-tRNA hydrolase [Lentisphaeria bacterium]